MVMAPPGGEFVGRIVTSAQPDIDRANRERVNQEKAALQQWALAQQQQLANERLALDQYKMQLQQQLAGIEQSLDRGNRMAQNPHTANYDRGGVVPRFAGGGAQARIVGYAPNGVPIYQDTQGQYVYYDTAANALRLVPPQLLPQVLGQPFSAGTFPLQGGAPAQTPGTPNPNAAAQKFPSITKGVDTRIQNRTSQPAASGGSTQPLLGPISGSGPATDPGAAPMQWSEEFKAAVAAREKANDPVAREREARQAMAYGEGRYRELPTFNPRPYAHGGEVPHEQMMGEMGGPPMPPETAPAGGPPNAVTGEGMDHDQTFGGEVVLIPTGEPGMYQAAYTEGPKVSSLPGGTLIVPLPPHLDEQFRAELPPLPGAPAEPTPDGGYAAGGRVYADGGMVPRYADGTPKIPGLPPLPPVTPFAGIQYATVPQNLQQFGGLSQMQLNRLNQQMLASGDLEGIEGRRRKLLSTAPGQSSLGGWSG